MLEFPPHAENALSGARSVDCQEFLGGKAPFRQNLSCSVILKLPCFFGLDNADDRLTCPAHSLWPAAKSRGPAGSKLFVSVNRRNFNRRLKDIMARMNAPQAFLYIPTPLG